MFEIDEKHRKQMDSIALISTCRECGKVGLNKNGTKKSGRNNVLIMYICTNCRKVYSERQLPDLVAGQPDASDNVSPARQRQATRQEKKLGSTSVKPDLNVLWEVYEKIGKEASHQKLDDLFAVYENSKQTQEPEPEPEPEPEVKLKKKKSKKESETEREICPICKDKTGMGIAEREPLRWYCRNKKCSEYLKKKRQVVLDEIKQKS